MKKKHNYQAVAVQQVRVSELVGLVMAGCIVALDVAKTKWLVAIATAAGEVVKLFRFEHPVETTAFLKVVTELRGGVTGGKVEVVMEPTGTYGDAVRYQLVKSGAKVFMVSPKRTHDSKEIFDGVPSLHDAKSAVLIAKLHAMGLSKEWQAPREGHARLRALVDLRQREERREEECHGWLEASLARHWPELLRSAKLREQKCALHLLVAYPSPTAAAAAPEDVKNLLRKRSRGGLPEETIDEIVAGAQSALGVPMVPEQERCVEVWASQALDACQRQEALEAEMRAVGKGDAIYERLRVWMGTVTAAVLMTMCDPMQFASARQLEKAAGLNMREKSSGEHSGRLSITKRGPGLVRQMLFLFALRTIHADTTVRAWYERRRGYREASKISAVVAVMRKLLRAAFHVARGSAFDASKLFDERRLGITASSTTAATGTGVETPSAGNHAMDVAETPAQATSVEASAATSVVAPSVSETRTLATETLAVTPAPIVASSVVRRAARKPERWAVQGAVRKRSERETPPSVDAPTETRAAATNAIPTSGVTASTAKSSVANKAHDATPPIACALLSDAPSTGAPMPLAQIASAAKQVLAACASEASGTVTATTSLKTAKATARQRTRSRGASRASP
jgi:transposase